ncbi:MAG: SAM-dependent methyltransferase [Flavobacteriaceae bacterium]|nr:SAM-dependent methyltransferase [Flavobacteriaceae bacterium]|tara:strand:- start:47214 stop:47879 length:666 start_codon:yes stop_codon:yes gene_type:complete
MKREFLTTGDGSITIHIPEWNEQYHSKHGAINEALHVFIQAGLRHFLKTSKSKKVQILEIGFGTGLNAFLTQLFSEKEQIKIEYTGVEAYPVLFSEIEKLNYPKLVGSSERIFEKLHQVPWEKPTQISENFILKKRKLFFSEIDEVDAYNLIYFDAFGARVQPELWTEAIFEKMYRALKPEGVLVTYAAKGSVRRAMEAVGFKVERLPGPPGKREMLRSVR